MLALQFLLGLLIGFIIKKALKIGVLLAGLALIGTYFGVVRFDSLRRALRELLRGVRPSLLPLVSEIPLSIGLVGGVIIGFLRE